MFLSPIRDVTLRAARMAEAGADIISFGAGDSEFETPEPIREAAVRAVRAGRSHYESIQGNPELRGILARQYREDYGVAYAPEEILITAAGTEGIFDVMMALIQPGDEAVILSPAFINYENCIRLAGGKAVFVPVREENGFLPDPKLVERAITDRTRMLVINNPCNPTGAVYPRKCLEKLAGLARKYDLTVFSDEVYDKIVYEDSFCSMAQLPDMKERTVIVNSFSKRFAMTGWRIGWLMACGERMDAVYKVHHYSTACQPTFIQDALAEALQLPETKKLQRKMTEGFRRRRDLAGIWLRKHPELSSVSPGGAFYYFINIRALGLTGREFALRLLEEQHVAVVPGEGLGKEFSDYIRLSYGVSEKRLEEGLGRIDRFLEGLP